MADELEKMQRALNQSYADRDRMASDLDKVRDDLERSQVCKNKRLEQLNKYETAPNFIQFNQNLTLDRLLILAEYSLFLPVLA